MNHTLSEVNKTEKALIVLMESPDRSKRTMEICLAMNPIVSKMKESLWKAISYLVANDERSILI